MNKLKNIYCFFLSKILLKVIVISICFFIIFNCVFSSLILNINSQNLSKISDIQKDIFSAIFFVSNAIEKINFSLTSKIVDTTSKKDNSKNNEDRTIPCQHTDFIVTNFQLNKDLSKMQLVRSNNIMNVLCVDRIKCCYNFTINYLVPCSVYVLFLLLVVIFFLSIKKIYNDNKIYNIYDEKLTVV